MAKDQQAQLKSIVETAVDGIITIDQQGAVVSFNPAAEAMFGYSAGEVKGKNISILMPPPYRGQHDGYLARYVTTGEKRIIGKGREVTGRRKDGTTFPLRLAVGEFRLGSRRMFTGIAHDLSEQRRAEQRAKQAERLAAIGQMLSVLSHESRNALQLTQANLEMLALEVEDRPELLDYVSGIQSAQNRLLRLFDELRAFSAPISIDREPCNLQNLVGRVLNELSSLHADKRIRLRHWADGVDLTCPVDPFHMHQVFRNILENSLAASPDPVRIAVAWSPVELNGTPALRATLRDNGPGLAEEQKQKVFEPFFTTKKCGSGLGLAITRRIVEAHGGQIAAGGNGHGGAEFVITLPRDPV